ncbi:carboxymuconolactone decarboxylase family protein [bacterium]|nr:carboxymuconolactone decarboxylase family protein [bacterium]
MTKADVYADIQQTFGLVPEFFKNIPESSLEQEWSLMKTIQLADGAIPQKYRELIGVGIAAATHCRYCIYFHSVAAKLMGATDEEIQAALQYAKTTTGWSTYINGSQVDFETFKSEMNQIADHIRSQMAASA